MTITPKIQSAINKAVKLHEGQFRKTGDTPYIVHPIGVALIIAQQTDDEDVVIAGLLHDILEDVNEDLFSAKDLENEFGTRVYGIMQEVSDGKNGSMSTDQQIVTWRQRKLNYIDHLKSASPEALLVSAADKLDNAVSLLAAYEEAGESVWSKFNAPKEDTIWFFNQVLAVLKERLNNSVVNDLETAVKSLTETTGHKQITTN